MNVHPAAIVHPKAKLADSVSVGPYAIIGEHVSIAANTQIGSSCVIEGHTSIGENCRIFTGAVVGSPPQDLKFKGERSFLEIGNNNIIREYVTINLGTEKDSKTIIGNDNLLMAYSHVAHNCVIGNGVIIANAGTLAGHVSIEDRVVIGGLGGVHQFARVGSLAILGGCSKAINDVPPYSMCDGQRAKVCGLNNVGLKRAGVSARVVADLKRAFRILFRSQLSTNHALERIKKEIPQSKELSHLIEFIQYSERGICK